MSIDRLLHHAFPLREKEIRQIECAQEKQQCSNKNGHWAASFQRSQIACTSKLIQLRESCTSEQAHGPFLQQIPSGDSPVHGQLLDNMHLALHKAL